MISGTIILLVKRNHEEAKVQNFAINDRDVLYYS